MTPSDAREQVVRLRFELTVGSWSPSHGECDAAVEALKALRLPDTSVAEALVCGTWAAASTAPWELPVEEGGSRLTRLMHDVAELLMSAEGGDAEERAVTRQNMVELLAATGEHGPPAAPPRRSRFFRRTQVVATKSPNPRTAGHPPISDARGKIPAFSYVITGFTAVVLTAVILLAAMPPVLALPAGLVLLIVLQFTAQYVPGPKQLRPMIRAGRRRAATERATAYRQYAATVTGIVQSVLKHWEQGTRLTGDEYQTLHEKLFAAPDVLEAHMDPYILACTNKMIPAIQDLLSSAARETRLTAQQRDALIDAFEERLREFDQHTLAAVRGVMGDQADLNHLAAA